MSRMWLHRLGVGDTHVKGRLAIVPRRYVVMSAEERMSDARSGRRCRFLPNGAVRRLAVRFHRSRPGRPAPRAAGRAGPRAGPGCRRVRLSLNMLRSARATSSRVSMCGAGRRRDADAAPDPDRTRRHQVGALDRAAHPVGDRDRGLGVREVLADDGELVAAEARHGVARPHGHHEPVAHLAQQLVADRVPELVVDRLEVVEVAVDDRDRPVVPAGAVHRLREPVVEQQPVREPGQRVGQGQRRSAAPARPAGR